MHVVKFCVHIVCNLNNYASFPNIVRKRLHGEVFSPSFSARNIFCKSRFRLDETSYEDNDNYLKDDHYEDSDTSYSHNDAKRNVLLKVLLIFVICIFKESKELDCINEYLSFLF